MHILIIGTGYVGLVTGACLAEAGHHVVCVDRDAQKLQGLQQGDPGFYEPGLDVLVTRNMRAGRLRFTGDLEGAVQDVEVIFIAVGTPPRSDGTPDLSALDRCVSRLSAALRHHAVVVIKSTVPPGTNERVQQAFDDAAPRTSNGAGPGKFMRIPVISNPEFLAEGRAIQDFQQPERIVVGTHDEAARALMGELYQSFDPTGDRLMFMSPRCAELAKYACNAMLAARVSLVNELARIAGETDADMAPIRAVMASDPRIGPHYLEAGVGYGGSCLPKDLQSLCHHARQHGVRTPLLDGIAQSNELQGERLMRTIEQCLGANLHQCQIAVWGLSFKPGTDDTRSSPALKLICRLLAAGARVRAHDPVAMPVCMQQLDHPRLTFADTPIDACQDADLLVVMTPWPEFSLPDFGAVASVMRGNNVVDGRQYFDPQRLQDAGLRHLLPWQRVRRTVEQGVDVSPLRATSSTGVGHSMPIASAVATAASAASAE